MDTCWHGKECCCCAAKPHNLSASAASSAAVWKFYHPDPISWENGDNSSSEFLCMSEIRKKFPFIKNGQQSILTEMSQIRMNKKATHKLLLCYGNFWFRTSQKTSRRGDIPFPPYSIVVEEVKHGMHNGVTLPNDSNRVAGVTRFDKKAPRII